MKAYKAFNLEEKAYSDNYIAVGDGQDRFYLRQGALEAEIDVPENCSYETLGELYDEFCTEWGAHRDPMYYNKATGEVDSGEGWREKGYKNCQENPTRLRWG